MSDSYGWERMAIAAPFIVGGWQAATRPGSLAARTQAIPQRVAQSIVVANGVALVASGLAFAAGGRVRVSGTVMAGCLLPSTVAAHPFWRQEVDRRQELLQFTKDLAMAGGALAVAHLDSRAVRGHR